MDSVRYLREDAWLEWSQQSWLEKDLLIKLGPATVSSRVTTVREVFDWVSLEIWTKLLVEVKRAHYVWLVVMCNVNSTRKIWRETQIFVIGEFHDALSAI